MRSVIAVLALLASSCDPGEEAPDGGSGAAALELVFQPSGEGGAVALDLASARFDEIRLVSDSGEDLQTAAEIDLLASNTVLTLADAAPGLYSRVRLKLGADDDGEALRVDGRFGAVTVELRARGDDEIDLRCPEGERLDPGGRLRIELDVDRTRWFAGVDLSSADVEGGVMVLDPDDGENRELAEGVVERVLESFSIGDTSSNDHSGEDDDVGAEDDDGGAEDDDGGPDDDGGAEDDGGGAEDDGGGAEDDGGGPDDGGAD